MKMIVPLLILVNTAPAFADLNNPPLSALSTPCEQRAFEVAKPRLEERYGASKLKQAESWVTPGSDLAPDLSAGKIVLTGVASGGQFQFSAEVKVRFQHTRAQPLASPGDMNQDCTISEVSLAPGFMWGDENLNYEGETVCYATDDPFDHSSYQVGDWFCRNSGPKWSPNTR